MPMGVGSGAVAGAGWVFGTGDGSAARRAAKIRHRPGDEGDLTFSGLAPFDLRRLAASSCRSRVR